MKEDRVHGYIVQILEEDLYDYLSNFSDCHLDKQIARFDEEGDEYGLNVCLDVKNDRKKMRKEIGGKYIEDRGIMHEILWRDEDDIFGIVPTTADENLNDYIVYEIRIDGISNTDRKDGDNKGKEVCDKTSNTEGKEIQSGSRVGRSVDTLWGQFLSRFSWHRERE